MIQHPYDVLGFDAFFNYMRKMTSRASGMLTEGAHGVTYDTVVPGEELDPEGPVLRTSWVIVSGGVYLNHTSTEATFTLTMPANPEDGDEITIASRSAVTTLTHNASSGQTVRGALTTIAANGYARYKLVGTVWCRIG